MRQKIYIAVGAAIAILIAALLSSCGPGASQIKLTDKDSGRSVEVKPGDTIIVELESNQTTGYQWSLTSPTDSAVLVLKGNEYRTSQQQTPLVGAGGTEVWTFVAQGAGRATLTLGYQRSWEKGVAPARTFTIEVVVR
jgi:inhibitor of cysteine peptidase